MSKTRTPKCQSSAFFPLLDSFAFGRPKILHETALQHLVGLKSLARRQLHFTFLYFGSMALPKRRPPAYKTRHRCGCRYCPEAAFGTPIPSEVGAKPRLLRESSRDDSLPFFVPIKVKSTPRCHKLPLAIRSPLESMSQALARRSSCPSIFSCLSISGTLCPALWRVRFSCGHLYIRQNRCWMRSCPAIPVSLTRSYPISCR